MRCVFQASDHVYGATLFGEQRIDHSGRDAVPAHLLGDDEGTQFAGPFGMLAHLRGALQPAGVGRDHRVWPVEAGWVQALTAHQCANRSLILLGGSADDDRR